MRRVAVGDAAAFEVVYDQYASRAMGLIVYVLGSRRDADEVLQEAFWKVWNSASGYDSSRGEVGVWIMMVVRSVAIDALRKRQRERVASETLRDGLRESHGDAAVRAEDDDDDDDRRRLAWTAFLALPDEQRELLELSFYRGMSHRQIADLQALPVGTVKTRIRSGMMKLREFTTIQDSEVTTP